MKSLPHAVKFYRRTPEFTEKSCPIQLKRSHSTKTGVWGRIVVIEGQLVYRIFESPDEEFIIDPDNPGVIEPCIEHKVEPRCRSRFFVEFYK